MSSDKYNDTLIDKSVEEIYLSIRNRRPMHNLQPAN